MGPNYRCKPVIRSIFQHRVQLEWKRRSIGIARNIHRRSGAQRNSPRGTSRGRRWGVFFAGIVHVGEMGLLMSCRLCRTSGEWRTALSVPCIRSQNQEGERRSVGYVDCPLRSPTNMMSLVASDEHHARRGLAAESCVPCGTRGSH